MTVDMVDGLLHASDDEAPLSPAWSPELLESKLHPPWRRSGLVRRAAVLERLKRAEAPIIAVVAPGGYGKSTLLAQWQVESGTPSSWLSLDAYDNDPAVLMRYLVSALQRIEPIAPEMVRSLMSPGAVELRGAGRLLGTAVAGVRTPFTMVIDHAETLENVRCQDMIGELALNLPEGSRLAVASRRLPPIPVVALRAQGRVEELGADDLGMNELEACALVRATGADADDEEVRSLIVRTEGWPVGLYLGALAMRAGRATAPRRASVRAEDRFVADYVRSEILSSLSADATRLLVRTSILEELSGPLCDAVVATTGSQQLLESLAGANLLVIPLDRDGTWYRCHHLLREVLSAELLRSEPAVISRLHDRAATWFEANGHPDLAIDHAQASGDAERAARLFCRVAQLTHAAGQFETVLRWLSWFEERGLIEQNPHVAVLGAIGESMLGHLATTEQWADAAASGTVEGLLPDGSPFDSWLALLDAALCRRGVATMRADAERAHELLSPQSPFLGPALFFEATAHLLEGDVGTADTMLADAVETNVRRRTYSSAVAAIGERAALAIDRRDWAAAERFSHDALAIVDEAHQETYVTATLAYAIAARVAAHGGDITSAREYTVLASRLRPLCTAASPISTLFLLQLGHAYLECGDPTGARAVVRQVREIMELRPDLGVVQNQVDDLQHMLDAIPVGLVGASSLTAAELRLLPLLATHLSYPEIGARLHVSRNTIKSEAASLFRKLGVSSRAEAVARAEAIGLLEI